MLSFTLLLYLFPTRKSVRAFIKRYFPATGQASSEVLNIFFSEVRDLYVSDRAHAAL